MDRIDMMGVGNMEQVHIPILMFACDRVTIARALDLIIQYRPSSKRFPIIVSQDCGDEATSDVIDAYKDQVIHLRYPDGDSLKVPAVHAHLRKYYRIADHYKWALNQVFDVLLYDQVIMVEDDMEISPDFFGYFNAMLPLLKRDRSLYCVSSWNDNGKAELISDPTAFYRTDFMPGLGWMMLKRLWDEELRKKWPRAFWDDWLRVGKQRQGRSCIIPEISRNFNFGKKGTSDGQFYDEHIGKTVANEVVVNYDDVDVMALSKERYDAVFLDAVYVTSKLIQAPEGFTMEDLDVILRGEFTAGSEDVRVTVEYANQDEFFRLADIFSLMDDIRVDVPRASYLGVVTTKRHIVVQDEPKVAVVYVAPRRRYWTGNITKM